MKLKTRTRAFGEDRKLSFVDKFGIWMSTRRIVSLIKNKNVSSMGDLGCGYEARLSQSTRHLVTKSVVVDVALSPQLLDSTDFETYVGELPNVLQSIEKSSLNFVVMNSVLEHLDEPIETLRQVREILAPDAHLFVNVPSWLGKRLLEFLAFKLNLSPAEEMEDHRRYYNKRGLWLELREAGYFPIKIRIRRHKFGTNVYAIVQV